MVTAVMTATLTVTTSPRALGRASKGSSAFGGLSMASQLSQWVWCWGDRTADVTHQCLIQQLPKEVKQDALAILLDPVSQSADNSATAEGPTHREQKGKQEGANSCRDHCQFKFELLP
jgi:hypothetical protein